MQALYGLADSNTSNLDLGTVATVDRAFKSLAEVMTNQVRSSAQNCLGAVSFGVQSADEVYIHVDWIWLIPTVLVLALCCIFFIATVVTSWRDELWKSSPLAYIYYHPMINNAALSISDIMGSNDQKIRPTVTGFERQSKDTAVRFKHRYVPDGFAL